MKILQHDLTYLVQDILANSPPTNQEKINLFLNDLPKNPAMQYVYLECCELRFNTKMMIEGMVDSANKKGKSHSHILCASYLHSDDLFLACSITDIKFLIDSVKIFNDPELRYLANYFELIYQHVNKNDKIWHCGKYQLNLGQRPHIMGVLNVTPDSFFDGGKYNNVDNALRRVETMIEQGADIIDIGAVSTRPDSTTVTLSEEIKRLHPVLSAIKENFDIPISIDTYNFPVMKLSAEMGVDIINNVYSKNDNQQVYELIKQYQLGYIVCHSQETNQYHDIYDDILTYFHDYLHKLWQTGINSNQLCFDINFGAPYGKDALQQYQLLKNMQYMCDNTYLPMLVGLSRKSFLSHYDNSDKDSRLIPSISSMIMAVMQGCHIVRVHDVAETAQALHIYNNTFKQG